MGQSNEVTEIRQGEELPEKKMTAFIRDEIQGLEGPVVIQQFPHGHSNLTYLISAGERQMVLRCPPRGTKAKTAHDMGREFRILSALEKVYPYCPKPLVYSEDESILGSPFYLMERIQGIIVRRDFPDRMNMTPDNTTRLFKTLLQVQYELHAIDFEHIGLGDFGKPQGYVKRQVEGWSRRYRAARTPDVPDGETVINWLLEIMPPDTDRPAIIHNDFKFDNVILDPENSSKIIGVLDWEMATLGDPLMDLGSSLGYWVEPTDPPEMQPWRMGPTNAPGALTRRQMKAHYEALSGRTIENFSFYYGFGLFRLAAIVQQIYYRYYHGQTKDKRFKSFASSVQALIKAANRVRKGEIQ